MHGILDDVRQGLRQFALRPMFALTATLTIAMGIAASAAIFTVVNGLILSPLPFPESHRLVFPLHTDTRSGFLFYPDGELVEAWNRADPRTITEVQAYGGGDVTLQTPDGPRLVRAGSASHGLLETLRLEPFLGRDFQRADESAGAPAVALLGYGFWHTAFGADPDVLGRDITIDGVPHAIIGVAPADLMQPYAREADRDLWRPLRRGPDGVYQAQGLVPVARLHDDATVDQAASELTAIARRASSDAGSDRGDWQVKPTTPADLLGPQVRTSLWVLLGAVVLVLVISCANVANLLLARGNARENELAVRAALGAGRARLIRHLLVESLLLGTFGGLLGFVLAHWGLDLIVALRPESLRQLERVRINGRVASFSIALTVVASIAFGAFPAARATRHALAGVLRSGAASILGGAHKRRVSRALIAGEVALSFVLLVAAGLLMRTLVMLHHQPIGFQPAGRVAVTIDLPFHRYPRGEARAAFFERLRDNVVSMPGLQSAHLVYTVPTEYALASGDLRIDGTRGEIAGRPPFLAANYVDGNYFRVLDIPIRRGRVMRPGEQNVVVVNESFARQFFAGADAVGQRIRFSDEEAWITIVGVSADLPAQGLAPVEPLHQLHFPANDTPEMAPEMLLVGTDLDAQAVRTAAQAALEGIDRHVAVRSVRTLSEMLQASLDRPRFNLALLSTLAVMAMLLSAVGLYGVVAVAVGERTREIGIRRALGETDKGVMALVLNEGLRPTITGIGVGLTGALAVTRIMTTLLFGLSPRDPLTLGVVPAFLAAVAVLACWIPARRAVRVEPMVALRGDG